LVPEVKGPTDRRKFLRLLANRVEAWKGKREEVGNEREKK
jgi:hypothetical protein